MKQKIFLVRHGECISNRENIFLGRSLDPPLTKKGVEQAKNLASHLQDKNFSSIYSSSLMRAKQTGKIISNTVGIANIESELLVEVDLGALDRKDISDPGFFSMYSQMVTNWEAGYEGAKILHGESLIDMNDRLLSFFNNPHLIIDGCDSILVVGHAILWMGFIWKNCINRPKNIRDCFMDIACYSIIERDRQDFSILNLNISP
jgi:2,3-bisphosphoglycerate-dependent phosphoglycerate mutase